MLPAEAPRTYSFAVPSRIVLWQHVDDLRPLSGITIEKWPTRAEARTRHPELVCPTANYFYDIYLLVRYFILFLVVLQDHAFMVLVSKEACQLPSLLFIYILLANLAMLMRHLIKMKTIMKGRGENVTSRLFPIRFTFIRELG